MMQLGQYAITQEDLTGVGVIGLADTPGLSATDMQNKLEETARTVIIPRFNAAMAGTATALAERPTQEAVRQMLDDKVQKIGAGDMARAIYDPTNQQRDIFAAIPPAGDTLPTAAGEADPGVAPDYARADHVHPLQQSVGRLTTPCNINGVAFDGTADITVQDDTKMPLAGGTFTGTAIACGVNRTPPCLRNIEVREVDTAGALQSTDRIIMVRK